MRPCLFGKALVHEVKHCRCQSWGDPWWFVQWFCCGQVKIFLLEKAWDWAGLHNVMLSAGKSQLSASRQGKICTWQDFELDPVNNNKQQMLVCHNSQLAEMLHQNRLLCDQSSNIWHWQSKNSCQARPSLDKMPDGCKLAFEPFWILKLQAACWHFQLKSSRWHTLDCASACN